MNIRSVEFIRGITGEDNILSDHLPQVAFVGRSNVGKSSVINSLMGRKDMAHSSAHAGRTRQINFYLINRDYYFVDLPGYGFAKASLDERKVLQKLIYWYLLFSGVEQKKIVLIIDANIGPTEYDLDMLRQLEEHGKQVIVVANKIDKIKKSHYKTQMETINRSIGTYPFIPYSAEMKIGINELLKEIQS